MAGKRLVVPGLPNKIMSLLPRLVPRGMLLSAMDSYQRRRNRQADGWPRRHKS